MKHYLLAALAAGIILPAVAVQQNQRSTAPTAGGNVKQMTRSLAGERRMKSPAKTLGEAPANTVEVPFTHDLGKTGTEIKNYIDINVNGDNRKWQYGTVNGYCACMVPNAADVENNDDWLISVPIHMAAGDYTLSYEVGMMGSGALGVEMDVWLFSEPTLDGKLAEIVPPTRYTIKDLTPYEYNCAIPEEGYYYVGFHCTTAKADKGTIKLANFGIKNGGYVPPVPQDPPAAGELTWTLAPKGELKAHLTYIAPTKTVSGADLTEISKVVITSRWEVDKFTYENVTPGETIELDVDMYQGTNNRFTAVAYAGDAAGEKVEYKNIFCGKDCPLAPTDVKLSLSDDYCSATLSWTAPGEVGEKGGYVDSENLTYYVFDAFGSYYDPALFTTDKTSVTIDFPAETQDFYAYQVTAGYGDYYSLDTASNIVVAGTPSTLPLLESFKDGYYDGYWLIDQESTGANTQNWGTVDDSFFAGLFDPDDPEAPMPLKSQDGDNGFYYWLPYEKDAMFGLVSTRVSIANSENPVLEFWYQGQGSRLETLIAAGTGELKPVSVIQLKENPTTGWAKASVSLASFKEDGAVQFELRLTATDNTDANTYSVPFDNISIRDLKKRSARFVTLAAPKTAKPGETISVKARIENNGLEAFDGAVVSVAVSNGNSVSVPVSALAPDSFEDVEVEFTMPVAIKDTENVAFIVNVADGEGTLAEETVEAKVVYPVYAPATGLTADVKDNEVTLSWEAPVNDPDAKSVILEDFENEEYPLMSINGVGGWTVYDGDGKKTYNIFRETYNPYQTAPMAFQLFNRGYAEVPNSYWVDAEAHSGESFMLAPSAQGALNDNHLISPELSGNAQTVTFWAKSFTMTWPESFSVNYSTTGNNPADFTNSVVVNGMPANGEVPEVWTEFSVELPEGAKYFEIVHDSYDSLALFVDDITYEGMSEIPADLAVSGYYVIRDGNAVNEELTEATSYTDKPFGTSQLEETRSFEYSVVAVYNYGIAKQSDSCTVEVKNTITGMELVSADELDGQDVYTLSGIKVDRFVAGGIYIVRNGADAKKVMVRK